MFERFTDDVRRAVLTAAEEASNRRGDPKLGTEHLLLGSACVGHPVADEFDLSPERIRARLVEWDARALRAVGIDADVESLQPPPSGKRLRRFLPRGHVPFNRAAKRALQRTLHICVAEGHRAVTVPHLLAALALGSHNDPAVRLLRSLGIEPADLDAAIRRSWRAA